jgi:hypothetical protein
MAKDTQIIEKEPVILILSAFGTVALVSCMLVIWGIVDGQGCHPCQEAVSERGDAGDVTCPVGADAVLLDGGLVHCQCPEDDDDQ